MFNKKIIAYHETGHAIMSFLLKDSILPTKICISITSKSLGYTLYTQDDDDLLLNTSVNNLLREVMILYAGRCSEKIFVNELTCGAEDDYKKARKILKRLVMNGMLIPEYNYVNDPINNYNNYDNYDNYDDKDKVPEHIEKIFNKINKFLIDKINIYLTENKQIIDSVANLIIDNGSINCDDITNIFVDQDKCDIIYSIDIITIKNDIINLIKID